MNNISKKIRNIRTAVGVATAVGFFLFASTALAATEQFAPTLAIPISTVKFTPAAGGVPYLGQYIGGLYEYVSAVASFLAGIMFVIGGLQYVTGQPDEGKKRIQNATVGLILTLSAYTILNTVNFNLTHFKPIPVTALENKKFKTVDFQAAKEKNEGDECEEAAECAKGLKCEEVKSTAAAAKELAVAGLEKAHQAELAIADTADTVAEGIYNSAMKVINDRVKALAVIDVDVAKAAAETLGKPVKAARDAAAGVRNKARAFADDKFKKAIDALSAQPTPTETPKKECTK